MTTLRECPECAGSGRMWKIGWGRLPNGCDVCHDEGWVRDRLLYDHRCPACRACDTCDGEGKVTEEVLRDYREHVR